MGTDRPICVISVKASEKNGVVGELPICGVLNGEDVTVVENLQEIRSKRLPPREISVAVSVLEADKPHRVDVIFKI